MFQAKRILGIDYGSVRIGVAVSDPTGIIADGVGIINNSGNVFDELKKIIERLNPVKIVIGMPLNLKGEKGKKAQEVELFAKELEKIFRMEVIRVDERFTSKIAFRNLIESGVTKKKRNKKGNIDRLSAAIILQSYLDSQSRKY